MALAPPFYIISDTHWYHDAILTYCNRPYDFETMMEKRWARVVKPNDSILHLGDLFFGGREGYEAFRTQVSPKLTGKKYIILGNHDKRRWDYEALGFQVLKPFSILYRGYRVSFDHYPKIIDEDDRKRIHVHGHTHNHPYSRGELTRFGNINVCVELLDYRPHRITRILNREILRRNGDKKRYLNSKYRWSRNTKNRGYAPRKGYGNGRAA